MLHGVSSAVILRSKFLVGVLLLCSACGPPPAIPRPDPIYLDPNAFIEFVPSADLVKWTQGLGNPVGEKYELMMQSFALVNGALHKWGATTGSQKIFIEFDDESSPHSPCIVKGFAAYTWTCANIITVCKRFPFGIQFSPDLYGVKGWQWMLTHETMHAFCEPDHVPQNGRADHLSGPIMCAWSSDCVDYKALDPQPEDLALLCKYIKGGPC